MRSRKRWAKVGAILAATAMALSACGTANKPNTEKPSQGPSGSINAFAAYDTTNWNPSNTSSALAVGANLQVIEGLYEFDFTNFTAHKALAQEDTPTKAGDLTYEIKLRDGAKFSDGTNVTSKDVVTSFERVIKGDSTASDVKPSFYAAFVPFIESVTAKDDSTVTLKLKYPVEALPERLAVVKIVPAKATFDQLTKMPIGSGPYKYDKITDIAQDLSVNEHYNGPTPATVEKIHYDNSRDATVRQTAAISGTTDIVESADPAGLAQLKKAGWKVEEATAYGYANMLFNTKKAPFDKPATRQGILTAIDTKTIISTALGGAGVKPTAFLPESSPVYKKAATQFNFDVNKAKALLEKGGAAGATVNFIVTTDAWVAAMGPQIKQNLEAAGLKVNLTTKASGDVWSNDVAQGTYDILLAPGDSGVFGPSPSNQLGGWYFSDLFLKERVFLAESDPATYQKLKALIAEADKLTGDAYKAKWGNVLDLAAESAAIYPVVFHTLYTAYNPAKVSDVKAIGTTGLQLLGVKAVK